MLVLTRALFYTYRFSQVHNIIVNQVLFPELSGGSRLLDARIRMQQVRLACMPACTVSWRLTVARPVALSFTVCGPV